MPDEQVAFVNPDGTFTETWKNVLPEEIRGEPSLADFKDFGSMAKSFVATKKLVGSDTVKIPGETATDEEKQAFFAKVGRPEKPEGYELKAPEKMPDGMVYDEQLASKVAARAHKEGISKSQLAAIYDEFLGYQTELVAATNKSVQDAYEAASTELKKEYGDKFDAYVESANKAMVAAGAKELIDKLGLANHPGIVKMFGFFGQKMSQDTLKGPLNGTPAADTQAQLSKIVNDTKHPYHDKEAAGHAEAVKEVERLSKSLYGDAKVSD
jgi:hypothetical protein